MRYVSDFSDYTLIDAEGGERLEQWGDIILIRPDPQIIWRGKRTDPMWKKPHAVYHRSDKGGGYWEKLRPIPDEWTVRYRDYRFRLKPMNFKHTGLFPEQAVNWNFCEREIKAAGRNIKVLNLFAYTGAATAVCLKAGAGVTHVDAAAGMVKWAKENAAVCGVGERRARWLVDDCVKFARREIRRGSRYDCIIMDPPSYGRGPGGEKWQFEEQIDILLETVSKLFSDKPLFFMMNTYTTGVSPEILTYLVKTKIAPAGSGKVFTDETGIPVKDKDLILPAGKTTIWKCDNA